MDENLPTPTCGPGTASGEHVFWLHPWKTRPGSAIDKTKLVRCTIDRERIRTGEALHGEASPVDIPISTVNHCDKTSNFRIPVHTVAIRSRKGETLLVPTNPFDPSLTFHTNLDEADALVLVINSFQEGQQPPLDPNPYLRQMQKKDRPRSVANLEVEWDENVSPLTYFERYRGQAAKMAPLLTRTLNLISIATVIAFGLFLIWWFLIR